MEIYTDPEEVYYMTVEGEKRSTSVIRREDEKKTPAPASNQAILEMKYKIKNLTKKLMIAHIAQAVTFVVAACALGLALYVYQLLLQSSPSAKFEGKEILEKCSFGWTKYGTSCYRLWEEKQLWEDAELRCTQDGGHLASILSEEERKFIQDNLYINKYQTTWIGANDRAVEGVWVWTDGSAWEFTDWKEGEPNNSGGEDCGHLYYYNGKWADTSCTLVSSFLCKVSI
eukprot:GFUD01131827.1.p1 GENE.GFUD01131827.1~~GFUD01131827.1.p1  ORF type:complete len:228 (-),score=41.75 GFUD01131827.1:15-698(-)